MIESKIYFMCKDNNDIIAMFKMDFEDNEDFNEVYAYFYDHGLVLIDPETNEEKQEIPPTSMPAVRVVIEKTNRERTVLFDSKPTEKPLVMIYA